KFDKEDYSYPIEKMVEQFTKLADLEHIQGGALDIELYELHIKMNLDGHDIWRKVRVPSTFSFRHLHNVIQTVFDWHNSHLHEFIVKKENSKPLLIMMDDSPDMMEFIDMEENTVVQERFTALEDVSQEGVTVEYM